ncbi:MAG: hypothetical protein ACRCX5_13320 [Bacteroidales bacterium]
MKKEEKKDTYKPVSIDAQARLMEIMNDSPSIAKLANSEWKIRALKPAVQWLIVEEACKMQKKEDASMKDIFLGVAQSFDSVIKIITWALLNDKDKIKNDFDTIYDLLKWESEIKDWSNLLYEVMMKIEVSFFFATTNAIQIMREMTTERKMTMQEQKRSLQGQNGGR